jgi:peptide/nickel transport system permease protein
MSTFILRRFLQTIPVLIGVALIAFVLSEMCGNPVRAMLGPGTSPEVVNKLKEYYGYDKPPSERFLRYFKRLAQGDLGVSITKHGQPANLMILDGLKVTAKLALGAILIASLLGLLTGILAAWRPNSWLDFTASFAAALGVSFPAFFLGMLLMLVFASTLRWLPIGGYEEGNLRYLVLPCIALGLISTASIGRLTRNCLLETLSQDYIRAGRAKGLGEWRVLLGHAVPNALVPVVTIIGTDFASLLSGAVLTETVFGLPGIGLVLYDAIFSRDLPVVMACCVVLALIFVVMNFLVDISYAFLDPRIHHG